MSEIAAMFSVMDPEDRRKLQGLIRRNAFTAPEISQWFGVGPEDQALLQELVAKYPPLRRGIDTAITQYYGSYAQFLATR